MQTGKYAANVGSRLKLAWKPGRRHLKIQPSSRIGENPPDGTIGGIEETSAAFEARSAPRSYPTEPHRPRVMRRCPRGHRASAQTARRGRRHWHVRTLFAREPGDLMVGQRQHACCTGPCREGEEP